MNIPSEIFEKQEIASKVTNSSKLPYAAKSKGSFKSNIVKNHKGIAMSQLSRQMQGKNQKVSERLASFNDP